MPCKHLYRLFDEQGRNLFATYVATNDLLNGWDDDNAPFELNKRPRESAVFGDATIRRMLSAAIPGQRQALEELLAARVVARARQTQNEAEQQRLMEEEENLELARAEGTATDCECCYSECAKNRMVYCNGDDPHVSFVALPTSAIVANIRFSPWQVFLQGMCEAHGGDASRALQVCSGVHVDRWV